MDVCRTELPDLRTSPHGEGHFFRCHLDDETRERIWTAKRSALLAEDGTAA